MKKSIYFRVPQAKHQLFEFRLSPEFSHVLEEFNRGSMCLNRKSSLLDEQLKGFKGTVVNRTLSSLHRGSLEIKITVPLTLFYWRGGGGGFLGNYLTFFTKCLEFDDQAASETLLMLSSVKPSKSSKFRKIWKPKLKPFK